MNNIFAKVVFALTCVLIAIFIGLGVYFCVKSPADLYSGLIGIGVGFVGAGVTGILMDGVLFNKNKTAKKTVVSSDKPAAPQARMSTDVVITGATRCESAGKAQDSLTAGFKADADGITVETLFPDKVSIDYADINTLTREGDKLRMSCSFEVGGKKKAGSFTIRPQSAIKAKAFEQFVRQSMEKVKGA